jgi:hypothetical protein
MIPIPLKQFVYEQAAQYGVGPTAIYDRILAGRYPGLLKTKTRAGVYVTGIKPTYKPRPKGGDMRRRIKPGIYDSDPARPVVADGIVATNKTKQGRRVQSARRSLAL